MLIGAHEELFARQTYPTLALQKPRMLMSKPLDDGFSSYPMQAFQTLRAFRLKLLNLQTTTNSKLLVGHSTLFDIQFFNFVGRASCTVL